MERRRGKSRGRQHFSQGSKGLLAVGNNAVACSCRAGALSTETCPMNHVPRLPKFVRARECKVDPVATAT
eukprot:5358850-Pyramimonas_sp.AAC.1